MILKETRKVTETNGPRPAGLPDRCFYCGQKIGEDHEDDCVCYKKTVVLTLQVELIVTVPASWDESSTLFWANESSSCFDNMIRRLVGQAERIEKSGKCSCHLGEVVAVDDATEVHHERFLWKEDGE